MKVLIVDHDPESRQTLARLGVSWGYECHLTDTVPGALDLFQKERIDIVISDWKIPEIDGLDLCRKVRALDKNGHTYVIICSERKSTRDLVQGIEEGADDYLAKPFEHEVLRARLKAGMRLLNLDRSLLFAKARLERGLTQAARTLTTLLPQRRDGPSFKIDWLFRPCAIIGGDLFNVFDMDENHFGLYAIDVSGHEVGATLFAVTLGHTLLPRRKINAKEGSMTQSAYRWNQSPVQVVSTLNERFQMEPPMNMFATVFYAVIDRRSLVMSWVRAGHPSPVIVRDNKTTELKAGDLPIGILSNATYARHTTRLKQGDRLFLYSDGITEAKSTTSLEMFGAKRLTDLMTDTSNMPLGKAIARIDRAILDHRGIERFDDDLSLLAVEIK